MFTKFKKFNHLINNLLNSNESRISKNKLKLW